MFNIQIVMLSLYLKFIITPYSTAANHFYVGNSVALSWHPAMLNLLFIGHTTLNLHAVMLNIIFVGYYYSQPATEPRSQLRPGGQVLPLL